jgi:hypothetical protein
MRPSPRRLLTFASAAVIATAFALSFATSPASAIAIQDLSIAGHATCQPDGTIMVDWSLGNPNGADATITQVDLTPTGTTVTSITVGAIVPANNGGLDGVQILPSGQTDASLDVHANINNSPVSASQKVTFDAPCAPLYTVQSTCDGLVITMKGPAVEGNRTFTLEPSNGNPQQITVGPGETKTVTLTGPPGFKVTVTVGNFEKTYTWVKPEDCTTTPPPTHSATPQLPTTGTDVTGFVSVGLVLVLAGAALLFVLLALRRRRAGTQF